MKLLILAIGRDIVEAAERQHGRKADAVLRVQELLPAEYPALRQALYRQLKAWQGEPVELILSGPLALAFTLGQLVGLNHFQVQVLQYDAAQAVYHAIPGPTRQEVC